MDNANVIIRPPIAFALAFAAGLGLDWLYPLPFVPASVPHRWVGVALFAAGIALFIWAIATFRRAGTSVQTSEPTTAIAASGPYRFTRNPIYLAMLIGQIALAIGFNSLWILATLVLFYFVLRYGVVAREESYLERKFGRAYLDYKGRVRRWV
jgi:protein-S-isoprenylcysteine O-methyltransferase Ste14